MSLLFRLQGWCLWLSDNLLNFIKQIIRQAAQITADNSFIFYWKDCQQVYPSPIPVKLSQMETTNNFRVFFSFLFFIISFAVSAESNKAIGLLDTYFSH